MEYSVNISKRRSFWSLNEDTLKITILTTNTPYPSRKIRHIRACTHQIPQRKQVQYAVSMKGNTPYSSYMGIKYSGRYQTWSLLQETPIRHIQYLGYAELRKNAYHGWIDKDVVNHIAKVLEMIDLIYIPGVDFHQLRMKVFPLSLADEARQWWINEGEGKITIWEELVEKFFCKFYPESYDGEDEMLDEGDNWGIDPLEFIS
ncbi:hypothetical protein Tco_0537939 [Tanacetum coccineum]